MSRAHFDDLDLDNLGFGGLGGLAVEDLFRVKAKPKREGVKVTFSCGACGAPQMLLLDWKEATVLSVGAIPQGFKLDQGYVVPNVGCSQCRQPIASGMTPDEAKRWVNAGIHAKFISGQWAQGVVNSVRAGRG